VIKQPLPGAERRQRDRGAHHMPQHAWLGGQERPAPPHSPPPHRHGRTPSARRPVPGSGEAAAGPGRPAPPGLPSQPVTGPLGGVTPRSGGATPAARRASDRTARQQRKPSQRLAEQLRAVAGSSIGHRSLAGPVANLQLSTHDQFRHPHRRRAIRGILRVGTVLVTQLVTTVGCRRL
jgi:hypothetical protein